MLPKLHVTRVFSSPDAAGSLTGMLVVSAQQGADQYQAIAAQLGFADTGFVWPEPGRDVWRLLSYSPVESLKFCTQTLFGAAAVRWLQQPSDTSFQFETANGPYRVQQDQSDPQVWWLQAELQPASPAAMEIVESLADLGIEVDCLHAPAYLAGVGRRRIYLPMSNEEELDNLACQSAKVDQWCREHALTAICAFVALARDRIRLRVWTTSLAGEEDSATGGAALGILALDAPLQLELASRITVVQGRKSSLAGGEILLRQSANAEAPHIGSRVILVPEGRLPDMQAGTD